MSFIKTVLIILFIYQGFKVLARFFAPFLMRYAAKKVQEKFKDQMGQQNGGFNSKSEPLKKEGEVHIKSKLTNKDSINTESVGDYVDFEEVEQGECDSEDGKRE
tara:strand:- start:508 stop:819 length:312 start_codon:yes stop_codon:yes gene_type:complete